ncbi:hypothetical protein M422DRAFT_245798 [Sphaerobolus stellatus SS14]|nr:hypothetical protein M422DRAFT_245798 [Sphaerobolus stellatus SS14]
MDLRAYTIALQLFLDSSPKFWPPVVFPIPSPSPHFHALSAHLSSKYTNVRGICSLSASSSLTSSSKHSMLACAWSHSIRIAKPAEKSEELEIYRLAHYSWHTQHAYGARMKDFYEVADALVALQELSIQYLFSDTPESLQPHHACCSPVCNISPSSPQSLHPLTGGAVLAAPSAMSFYLHHFQQSKPWFGWHFQNPHSLSPIFFVMPVSGQFQVRASCRCPSP